MWGSKELCGDAKKPHGVDGHHASTRSRTNSFLFIHFEHETQIHTSPSWGSKAKDTVKREKREREMEGSSRQHSWGGGDGALAPLLSSLTPSPTRPSLLLFSSYLVSSSSASLFFFLASLFLLCSPLLLYPSSQRRRRWMMGQREDRPITFQALLLIHRMSAFPVWGEQQVGSSVMPFEACTNEEVLNSMVAARRTLWGKDP